MNEIIKCVFLLCSLLCFSHRSSGMMPFPTLPSFDGITLNGATPRSSGFQYTSWIPSGDLISFVFPFLCLHEDSFTTPLKALRVTGTRKYLNRKPSAQKDIFFIFVITKQDMRGRSKFSNSIIYQK